ncbi:MAG TPA: hypothetical protein VMU24_03850 [Candidatus Acidoferrales bacterium]|nr:hypothetical protein [Candidatus Acidoferrales bacterium]
MNAFKLTGLFTASALLGLVLLCGLSVPAHAQGLGWEGETGVFVTPLAYTQSTENGKARATAAYHYLNAGSVIGDFHEASIEVGIGKRIEFGYTREFHSFGSANNGLSTLWQNGFDIMNAKVNVIPEGAFHEKWMPAISFGGMARTGVRNVGNYVADVAKDGNASRLSGRTNGDVYVVGSKMLPTGKTPILISAGVRGTDAELWGMGGNAPDWTAQGFGSVAVVCPLPHKNTIIFASEAAHQPHHPYMFDGVRGAKLNIPTTLTYAARFIPNWKYKVNFDVGVAQIAGQVAQGVDLKARHQVGVQMSYAF